MCDPIDRICAVFEETCDERLVYFEMIYEIIESSKNFMEAVREIREGGHMRADINLAYVILNLPAEINKLQSCLQNLPYIKLLARRVLAVNFFEDEKYFTFNQEVCFSYACKMQSSVGPSLRHFSNNESITVKEIRDTEIKLAMHSPTVFTGPDLLCHEEMPEDNRPEVIEIPSTPPPLPEVCLDLEAYGLVPLEWFS